MHDRRIIDAHLKPDFIIDSKLSEHYVCKRPRSLGMASTYSAYGKRRTTEATKLHKKGNEPNRIRET